MPKKTKLWFCGDYRGEVIDKDGIRVSAFAVLGIFSGKSKARKACTKWYHFIAPLILNQRVPDEIMTWKGAEYPIAKKGGHQCQKQQ